MAYTYESLTDSKKEVRLLTLFPSDDTDTLKGSLHHQSLQFLSMGYETVSYAWGSRLDTQTMLLDGFEISIPASSAAALRRLRRDSSNRILWIDALCINQHDLAERSSQVAIMRDIYSLSKGNIIYLGESDGTEERALQSIRELVEEAYEQTEHFRLFVEFLFGPEGHHYRSTSPIKVNVDYDALICFYSRPWFRRVWVVQEAALAPRNTIICGHHTVLLESILIASAWLNYKQPLLPSALHHLSGIWGAPFLLSHIKRERPFPHRGRGFPIQIHLSNLLIHQQGLEASDPRDRVYGLLGLSKYSEDGTMPSQLLPDYTKTLSEVLCGATMIAMSEDLEPSGGLSLMLARVFHFSKEDLNDYSWPSWVPRWDTVRNEPSDYARILHIAFDASAGSKPPAAKLYQHPKPLVLELQGFIIKKVVKVSPILAYSDSKAVETLQAWLTSVDRLAEDALALKDVESCQQRLGSNLVVGMNADRDIATDEEISHLKHLKDYLEGQRKLPPALTDISPTMDPSVINACRYYRALVNGSVNRRFFLTDGKMCGMGPRVMENGDIVAILFGTNTPYILRRCGERYQILGQCYVDGIMYGEALREHRAKDAVDEIFTIF